MIRRAHVIFFLLAFFSTCQVFALKVMTFNLLMGGKHKKEALLKVLEKGSADIIIINEANNIEVFNGLAKSLGFYSILSVKNHYNVGILSRYPIKSHTLHQLDVLAKSFVEVHVKVPEFKDDVIVFACHLTALSTNKRRKKRLKEMAVILPIISKYQGRKIIFAGDMNEVSHLDKRIKGKCVSKLMQSAGLIDSFRNYHEVVEVAPGYTHNILMIPTKRIDYIYLSKHFKIVSSDTIDKKNILDWPSDHAAVVTEVEIKKDTSDEIIAELSIPKEKKIFASTQEK